MRPTWILIAMASAVTPVAGAQLRLARPIAIAPRPIAVFAPAAAAPAPTPTARETPAPAAPGVLACALTENGIPAPASVVLRQSGRVIVSGSCARPLSVPSGTYEVILTLENALDRPSRTLSATVIAGRTLELHADLPTAILEVRFLRGTQIVPGLAFVERDGRAIGSVGSGVLHRLTPGAYRVVARTSAGDRAYDVVLEAGGRRAVRVPAS
ncbi:MAG: hypothetical protein IT378_04040 [Sandaracinaceae bacterium]|nr:hypothetical protein [Sandaracinaceae bacterium]